MSVQEIQALAQQFADGFDTKNIEAVLDMLSDDLEVFDHVPYRFDNNRLFAAFLNEATEGIASMHFGFRQPSCRVFNENTGIVNAYDSYTGVTLLVINRSPFSSDQQYKRLAANVTLDRNTASRLGLSTSQIDDTLYDAFGQRELSTMYTQLDQYYVVMEVAPQFWQNPDTLKLIHLSSNVAQPAPSTPSNSSGSGAETTIEASSTPADASTYMPPATGMSAGIQSTSDSSTAAVPSSTTGMIGGVSSTIGSSTANLVTPGSTISALPGVTSTSSDTDSSANDTTAPSQPAQMNRCNCLSIRHRPAWQLTDHSLRAREKRFHIRAIFRGHRRVPLHACRRDRRHAIHRARPHLRQPRISVAERN